MKIPITFYECRECNQYHPCTWVGNCTDTAETFALSDLSDWLAKGEAELCGCKGEERD